ncbi:sugar transferase [Nocardia puris]|uniref:Exopolysaccharide biosynthesis polyprenyl glycosylphosphotransferase n=2 Tax=Nocardia puris TaxID=208602 RepID=A0A366DYP5_9NOCA|nr:sugar transferase [Nocardia puris]RBO94384.1 exopolysaccharide biosynthesis polyprenyl glycosylphosphotransferase [Nocardia puris]
MESIIDRAPAGLHAPVLEFPRIDQVRSRGRHARRVFATDALVIAAAVGLAQWYNGQTPRGDVREWVTSAGAATSLALACAWLLACSAHRTRSARVMAAGVEEYRRLAVATVQVFGLFAIAAGMLRADSLHGYLVIAMPAGLFGLVLTRWSWRSARRRASPAGPGRGSVVVYGAAQAAREMAGTMAAHGGYGVVGVVPPGETPGGDHRAVIAAVRRTGADYVVVAPGGGAGAGEIRRLAWELDPLGAELIIAPGVIDVARIRLSSHTVAGVPMLHVGKPRYDRATARLKATFDMAFALTALLLTAPVLIAIAVAVKVSSAGPVFYRSERIGLDGKPFRMTKFRSMTTDADRHAEALIAAHGGGASFFKLADDPRVTPVGRILRKYSLDELPQFFDVLRGDMSVVGPRPQVWREVAGYDGTIRRRLLVKPGITGLWQVSGRSDLSPEESYRLDLSYVENWSMGLDLRIIARTLTAVVAGDGAY